MRGLIESVVAKRPRHPYWPERQDLWQYKNFARYDALQIDRAAHGAQFSLEAEVDEHDALDRLLLGAFSF